MPDRGGERSELRRLGQLLSGAVGRGQGEVETMVAVFAHWDHVVGPQVARHVRPLRLKDDVLLVTADQGAWATQARVLSAEIIRRLSEVTGTRIRTIEVSRAK